MEDISSTTTNYTTFSTTTINYDDYYYTDGFYNYDEYYIQIFSFEIVTLGTVRPLLVLLTTLTNLFIVGYFVTRKNRGKASNILFTSIAISDTLTGLSLLPNSFYVYAKDISYLTADWCMAYMTLRLYVSPVFHTVSIWQTLLLGIQRYMCVCHPFVSTRVCTPFKTIAAIIVIYIFAIVLHVYHLVHLEERLLPNNECAWIPDNPCSTTCMYLWFVIFLMHIIPVLTLALLTIITIIALKRAQRRASTIISNKKSVSENRSNKEKIITITSTLIVICFLIPELPFGFYRMALVITHHDPTFKVLSTENNHILLCVYELALIITFNANFWIYCAMMYEFRHTLLRLLTFGTIKQGVSRLRSLSASSMLKGGSRRSSSVSSNRNRILSQTTSIHSTASDNLHTVVRYIATPTKDMQKLDFPHITYDPKDDDVFV